MIKLQSIESFTIKDRGEVFIVNKPKDYDFLSLINKKVLIDDKCYLVKGIEIYPKKPYIQNNIGLLVKAVDIEKSKTMTVKIKFSEKSIYYKNGYKEETLEEITDIYYAYKSPCPNKRVAFESDTLSTGYTYDLKDIESFNVISKKGKHD